MNKAPVTSPSFDSQVKSKQLRLVQAALGFKSYGLGGTFKNISIRNLD